MSMILEAALRIQSDLPMMGGQKLVDAERDLEDLRSCACILGRLGIGDVSPEDAGRIKAISDSVEERREAWARLVSNRISAEHADTNLEWMHGVDATDSTMRLESTSIHLADKITVTIEGVQTTVPSSCVRHEGETLTVETESGDTVLDLPLRDVAAFGFVSDLGEDEIGRSVWTGFDILTMDSRLISLR